MTRSCPGYDIEDFDSSILSKRSMAQIGGDKKSAEWKSSRPAAGGKAKANWIEAALAKAKAKKKSVPAKKSVSPGKDSPGKSSAEKKSAPSVKKKKRSKG